ncbi:phosphate ABC transporter ATP-binding protein [Spirulina sp. CCNP1310]|uniref:phosphate ABC transporter ATP-binding protein n=1 Tax=Spirulina sp. CCNP1310 TaxID=3110249 RepID=UPI002B21925F|nr:phosphate ABC transporter ATP-binding protein [Spirulina sp. CCNP1310]MEA5419577.1 phosphate ABC transporter ATP-binding protein [Spirulina sp. CCNP1310]
MNNCFNIPPILTVDNVNIFFEHLPILKGIHLTIEKHKITGIIGPSGCGKSTLLRCFNRLNELIPGMHVQGKICLEGQEIHALHPVELRRRIGMVSQRPNPFPRSIYENIALGLRINGCRHDVDDRVEYALQQVGLWPEVNHKLKHSALELSGGQQQRLCIARAIALNPEVLLMDEPTAALDPMSVRRINDLLLKIKEDYTIVLITHNLKQAALITDQIAFFNVVIGEKGNRYGVLVEHAPTIQIFMNPHNPMTWEYVTSSSHHTA